MKLVMTLCVKNEADIVRENIEFHLNAGVDFIIATDNRSDDETESILREYQRAGLLHYLYSPSPFFKQSESVTKMARMAYLDYDADWVINNDVDEFWWTPSGNLKNLIRRYCERKPTDALQVNRVDFVSDQSNEKQHRVFYQHMTKRRLESTNSLAQPLPPKLMHRADPSVIVHSGNHNANGKLIKNKVLVNDAEIVIFHFPIRSYQHLLRKATKDYQARRKSIYFSTASSSYTEYNRLYNLGRLRDYYDNYCGIDQINIHSVVSDFRFKRHMVKIMKEPVLKSSPHACLKTSALIKLRKWILTTFSFFSESIFFFLKKTLYQLKRYKS